MTGLRREVRPRESRAGLWFGAAVIAALGVSAWRTPTRRGCFGDSKIDIAKLAVQKLANEGYPMWVRAYGAGCPRSVYELTEFTDAKPVDLWGHPYRMWCKDGRVFITSVGEDGRPNTIDDLRSWD